MRILPRSMVALHPEGVDRNNIKNVHYAVMTAESPSTRRAWIEIAYEVAPVASYEVSPSTRRAWIEIGGAALYFVRPASSPSTRRAWIEIIGAGNTHEMPTESPSTRRAWIEMKQRRFGAKT